MLVLGFKIGDRVVINENVVVTVLQDGKRMRLGFDAPKEVSIKRHGAKSGVREDRETDKDA